MGKRRKATKILSMCAMLIFVFEIFVPQKVMADSYYYVDTEEFRSGEPYIETKGPIVEVMSGVITTADIYIRHTNKNAVYTAVSSNEEIGVLASAYWWPIPDKDLVGFSFRAKKAGSFNVTIKEKIGGKTKKLGVVNVTFEKSSRELKGNAEKAAKKCKKYLKKGIVLNICDEFYSTELQLEVKSIKSLKKTKNKITAVLQLDHKVTADEYKACKESFPYSVTFSGGAVLQGELKRGSKTVTVTSTNALDMERMKKGKVYYLTGLDVSKNSPYLIGKKCK